MGLRCAKLRCLCCCRCCSGEQMETSVLSSPQQFKVLLLGPGGSGKTQLGHLLSGKQRDAEDQGATNGVRVYRLPTNEPVQLSLTEVGGNPEMQRLWPHYYVSAHALIYCFDLSLNSEELESSFELLRNCLSSTLLTGKPVLLVASRHRDGVQLYDVEHAFGLEQLACRCNCPLHICHMDQEEDLAQGLRWLQGQLSSLAPQLEQRIRYDMNMASWQRRKRSLLSSSKLAQVHRQRFRRQHRKLWPVLDESSPRPCTAPASVFIIRTLERQQSEPEAPGRVL